MLEIGFSIIGGVDAVDVNAVNPHWWGEVDGELAHHGFRVWNIYSRKEHSGRVPDYAIILGREQPGLEFNDALLLERVFDGLAMTVVDLAIPSAGPTAGASLCVWLQPHEKLDLLPPILEPTGIEARLEAVGARLMRGDLNFAGLEIEESRPNRCGRLLLTNQYQAVLEIILGAWAWTAWNRGSLLGIHTGTDIESLPAERYGAPLPKISIDGGPWEIAAEVAVMTSCLVPFVQAFATKAGEDCYNALRTAIGRYSRLHRRTRILDAEYGTELVFVPPLPDEAIKQLAMMRPKHLVNRIVEWDADGGVWKISSKPRPRD